MTNQRIFPIILYVFLPVLLFSTLHINSNSASAVCLSSLAFPGFPLDITSPAEICSPVENSGTVNVNIPGAKDQDPKPELKIITLVTIGEPGGSLNNKAAININEGVLRNDTGALVNSAGGTININGQLSADGSVNQLKSGILSDNSFVRGLSNSGTININQGGTLNANGFGGVSNTGTINMAQGSTFNSGGRFVNDRRTLSDLATVTMAQGSAFNMSGGTLVNNGKFDMVQSSSFTINGGRLEGTGTITGTVNNVGGVVAPGGFNDVLHATTGKLNVGGYTQAANGALNFMIGQHQGLRVYTALNVSGPISILGGTISVSLNTGFVPKVGDKFNILTGQIQRISLSSPISLPPLPAGQFWGRANFGSFFELSVRQVQSPVLGSPEPGSFLLFCSGSAWLVGRYGRKHPRVRQTA
ncbi:MAG: hypothetical protein KF784_18285 [Fimbriimonadaceae bacterium]|nr:hypothetical protein [Fimbriimonadaceae bacterium]MBX3649434.1 hypothetical protein [Rhodocyclaceae bacterium]